MNENVRTSTRAVAHQAIALESVTPGPMDLESPWARLLAPGAEKRMGAAGREKGALLAEATASSEVLRAFQKKHQSPKIPYRRRFDGSLVTHAEPYAG